MAALQPSRLVSVNTFVQLKILARLQVSDKRLMMAKLKYFQKSNSPKQESPNHKVESLLLPDNHTVREITKIQLLMPESNPNEIFLDGIIITGLGLHNLKRKKRNRNYGFKRFSKILNYDFDIQLFLSKLTNRL